MARKNFKMIRQQITAVYMKNFILYLLRGFGFFKLSKFLVRKKLLILAYHGVEMNDESRFRPKLFIRSTTLEQRMEYLHKKEFNVLGLDEALRMSNSGMLPENAVVITVDDGWYSTHHADRIFSEYSYPYTVYVTSYFIEKELPVLNVALSYILWSSDKPLINLDLLGILQLSGQYSLSDPNDKQEAERKLFMHFEHLDTAGKAAFIKKMADILGVDYEKVESSKALSLLSFSEIKKLSDRGVNIQLHTHRHNVPLKSREKFEQEIEENRYHISPHLKNRLEHFCYPSGQYDKNSESILKSMGVVSATTCEPGFINHQTNPYYLPRFLDGENIPQIVFEAEICGAADMLRSIRSSLKSFKKVSTSSVRTLLGFVTESIQKICTPGKALAE